MWYGIFIIWNWLLPFAFMCIKCKENKRINNKDIHSYQEHIWTWWGQILNKVDPLAPYLYFLMELLFPQTDLISNAKTTNPEISQMCIKCKEIKRINNNKDIHSYNMEFIVILCILYLGAYLSKLSLLAKWISTYDLQKIFSWNIMSAGFVCADL